MMKIRNGVLAAAIGLLGLVPLAAYAQTTSPGSTSSPAAKSSLPPVTLDVKDAPLRQVLEQLFNTAKVDYSIDNSVTGYVTLRVTEQPFDNALRLVLRSSPVPLSYTVDSGVYIVKPRPVETYTRQAAPQVTAGDMSRKYQNYEVIQLTYIDPADLAQVLGLTYIPTFSRQSGRSGGGVNNASRGNSYGGNGSGFLSNGFSGGYSDYGNGNSIFGTSNGYGNNTPGASGNTNMGNGNR
jgi:type II secretory pathway component GspD/PulD (secretin)